MSEGNMGPLARWDVGSKVNSIALSRVGSLVASGSSDNYVRVWDVHTGALVLGPLKGHADMVRSVAFSPDNTQIASGSYDYTIRIWDARTGTPTGEPLKGHTGVVLSVAFSHDSTRIVSGSGDYTIRVWDARTGAPIGRRLKGHTNSVYSVAFSHDSTRIVSGSRDNTIYIWDAHTGTPIDEPLKRHTSYVYSVAFSHDSTRIISGSRDCTIRIWDARTGTPIGEPLEGHTDLVNLAAFSHDSSRIVSGSWDNTIRIWDACTGTPIGEPLKGHSDAVYSVAFSHDSLRIFSGSGDGTIGVWQVPQNTPSFDMVTSKMSAQEMFECLVKHGCTDLTSSIDADRRTSAVIASGGFGDVRRVTLEDDTFVALKTIRLHILHKDNDKAVKRAVREVYLWSRLHHPNIQELLGIIVFKNGLGMVSPWRKQGNLHEYIEAHPDAARHPLCVQLASAVSYLHSIGMVHGDIKSVNVLMADDGTLKISDFDYAMMSTVTLQFTKTTRPGGGTLRWMAPELFPPDEEDGDRGKTQFAATRSKQTDVYALGMTMLEIVTGTVPYAEYRHDLSIYRAIDKKTPPRCPEELSGTDKQSTKMWKLLLQCWDHNPSARPDASSILASLQSFTA